MHLIAYVYTQRADFVNTCVDLTLLGSCATIHSAIRPSRGDGVDPRLDRLFSSLEAQFGAAIERAEEDAASDLALSLRQGRSLRETLLSSGWDAITSVARRPVTQVALDHVRLGGGELMPIASGIYERTGGELPDESEQTLLQVLRDEVRRGGRVSVETPDHSFVGRACCCSSEHLVMRVQDREIIVPLGRISVIRLSLED